MTRWPTNNHFRSNSFDNFFSEYELICGILETSNYKFSWLNQEVKLNWFQVISLLEKFFKNISLEIYFLRKSFSENYYHPKNCLSILYKNEEIGTFGEINRKSFPSDIVTKNYFIFEINFTKILLIKNNKKQFY